MNKTKKILFIILGLLFFVVGTIGLFLPVMPTVPFYLATVFFFSRSSERLNSWFKSTKLYEKTLKSYVESGGMTKANKIRIMVSVSILLLASFILMRNVLIGKIAVGIVWLSHMMYFIFAVKTID